MEEDLFSRLEFIWQKMHIACFRKFSEYFQDWKWPPEVSEKNWKIFLQSPQGMVWKASIAKELIHNKKIFQLIYNDFAQDLLSKINKGEIAQNND